MAAYDESCQEGRYRIIYCFNPMSFEHEIKLTGGIKCIATLWNALL